MEEKYLELHQDYTSYANWHYEQYTLWSYYSWYLQHYIQYIRQRESDLATYWARSSENTDPSFGLDDIPNVAQHNSFNADYYYYDKPIIPSHHKEELSDSTTVDQFTDNHFKIPLPKKSKKKKKRRRRRRKMSKTESETIEEEEETDLEIEPAFKEFLRQSLQFKREREAAKRQARSGGYSKCDDDDNLDSTLDDTDSDSDDNTEYVDLMKKGPEGTILPPTATNRKELYDSRYGTKGTTILSLETALQWKFMQFIDQKSPTLWPNLPLNL